MKKTSVLSGIKCNVCGSEFVIVKKTMMRAGIDSIWCKKCQSISMVPDIVKEIVKNKRYKPKEKAAYGEKILRKHRHVELSAKSRNIKFDLEISIFSDWWKNSKDICHYCKCDVIKREFLREKFKNTKLAYCFKGIELTVDRKDSNSGYVFENIVKACYACNITKSAIMSESDALLIMPVIINRFLLE